MTSEPTRPPERRFRRFAAAVCGALLLVAAALSVAGIVRGPTLSDVRVQPERAVLVAGERAVFRTRQPIAPVRAEQVTVTPAARFTVESRDLGVAVTFPDALAYGTDYTVTIRGVTGRHSGVSVDWSADFTTPGVALYTLLNQRSDSNGVEDQVVRVWPETQPVPVLSAMHIESFAVVGRTVFAISQRSPDDYRLLVQKPGEPQTELETPAEGVLTLLKGSPELGLVGYTSVVPPKDETAPALLTLYLQDAADLNKPPHAVTGSDGRPLAVVDWAFIPGSPAVVVQDEQSRLQVVSVDGQSPPTPLGTHDQILGMLPARPAMLVRDGSDVVILDLGRAESTIQQELAPPVEEESVLVQRQPIAPDDEIAQFDLIDRSSGSTARVDSIVYRRTADRLTELLSVPQDAGRVLTIGASSNAQYAWVEVLDAGASMDEVTSGASTRISLHLIDLATNTDVGIVAGHKCQWALVP